MSSSRNAPVPPPLQQDHEPLKTVRVDRSMIPDLDGPPPVAPAPAQSGGGTGGGAKTMVLPRYEPPEGSARDAFADRLLDDLDGPTMAVPRYEPSMDAFGVPPVAPPPSAPPPPVAPPPSSAPPRFEPVLDAPDAHAGPSAIPASWGAPRPAPMASPAVMAPAPMAPAAMAPHAMAPPAASAPPAAMASPFPRAEGEEEHRQVHPSHRSPRAPMVSAPPRTPSARPAPALQPAPPAAHREGTSTAETALIPRAGRRRPGRPSALPLAHDLLRTIVDLGRADPGALPPVGAIEAQLRGAVERFRVAASEAGHPVGDIDDMSYALVAFADESLLSRSDELRDAWAGRLLQIAFFRENTAGEGFFVRLEGLLPDRTRRPVLEVFAACLFLGFRGRYAVRGGDAALQNHIESVRRTLQLGPDALDVALSPRPYVPPPLLARGGGSWLTRAALVVFVLAIALYVGLQIDLGARAAALGEPSDHASPAALGAPSLAPRQTAPVETSDSDLEPPARPAAPNED